MLVERNSEREKELVKSLIASDDALKKQHEYFKMEMQFKQLLIDARKEKGMTQKDISSLTGLSQQAVSRLEKGKGGTIETVLKYLSALGMTLSVKEL